MLQRAKNKLAELKEIMALQVCGGHGEIAESGEIIPKIVCMLYIE